MRLVTVCSLFLIVLIISPDNQIWGETPSTRREQGRKRLSTAPVFGVRRLPQMVGGGGASTPPRVPARVPAGRGRDPLTAFGTRELHFAPMILSSLAACCLVSVTGHDHQVPWGLLEVQTFRPSSQNLLTDPQEKQISSCNYMQSFIFLIITESFQHPPCGWQRESRLVISFLCCVSDVTS